MTRKTDYDFAQSNDSGIGNCNNRNTEKEMAINSMDSIISTDRVKLKAEMGLLQGVTVIVGSIIGSGIFVSPKGVLEGTGSIAVSLIVWLLCGVFSMIGSYCFAELGSSITRSGGDYAYIYEAFGSFVAFIRLWVECMIVRPCLIAIISIVFGTYIVEPLFPDCEQPENAIRCLAAFCICILTFVNSWSVKWATKVQDVFTFAKVAALIMIILTGFYQLANGEVEYFKEPFSNTITDPGKVSLAFYSGLFAYNGWNYLNYVLEELKDPGRNLPLAICISMLTVTVIYILTNIAYFTTVSPSEMLAGSAVAVMFTKRLYGVMWWIMPIFVSFSTFGTVNAYLFTSSRLFFVASREGHMPDVLKMVQIKRFTPVPAVLFTGAISLCYLVSSDIFGLINYVSFSNWGAIGLGVVSLLVMRVTRPNLKRPLKVALVFPIVYLILTAFLVVLPFYADPSNTAIGCLIVLSGVPVYLIFVTWQNKPKSFTNLVSDATILIQKFFLVVPEEVSRKSQ